MVTLDGELVTPGGALTGGNHEKERSSLLARQRQILELEQSVQQLAEQMEQQNKALDIYYAITGEKKATITELHSQDQELIRRAAQLEQQLNQQQREESRLQKEISFEQFSLQEQQQQLQEQQTALEQEKRSKLSLRKQNSSCRRRQMHFEIIYSSSRNNRKFCRIPAIRIVFS